MTGKGKKTAERLILEQDFGGDLEAYAENRAGPATPEIRADPAHPWHHRKRCAKLLIDMPEDHRPPPHLSPLHTRAEVVAMLGVSDSGFGKIGVPIYRKSGRWAIYRMLDVLGYAAAHKILSGERRAARRLDREPQKTDIHRIATEFKAAMQTGSGYPGPYYFPKSFKTN